MAHAPSVLDAEAKDLRTVSTELRTLLGEGSVTVRNADHLHGMCGGLKSGEIIIEGDCGDYLGVVNSGALIKVMGNSGKYVADNMTSGEVIVNGDAGYGAAQYCYGGLVVIRGDAGDFTATMNKGATILIGGDVGAEAATYMVGGDVIILGNAGENLGNYLIRGNIYIRGEWASLGHNCSLIDLDDEDHRKLDALFKEHGINPDGRAFRRITPLSDKPFYSH